MITTTIEIDAPPSKVRSVYLDFPNLGTFHTGFLKAITPLRPFLPRPLCPRPWQQAPLRDRSAICRHNHGILSGVHTFMFEQSKVTRGDTTLAQDEEFGRFVFWAISPWLMDRVLKMRYERFNEDLKRRVKRMKEGGKL